MVAAAAPLLLFTDVANIQAAAAPPLLKAPDKQNSDRYSAPTGVRNSSSTPEAVQAASSSAVCPEPTSHGAIPPKPENQTLPATPARLMNIDLNYESPLSRLELTPFRYGHGTELHPITEQRSIATLRNGIVSTSELETSRNRYNNNLSMSKHADENSHTQTTTTMFPIPRRRVRRQQSFSLDSGRTHLLGGGQDARKQQYQQILHRKETTSASSYSSVLGGRGREQPIDSARVLAELKSYPHTPPYSPHQQVVTPPEYYEWVLSHPNTPADLYRQQAQRHAEARPTLPGTELDRWNSRDNAPGGDRSRHTFVRGTTCFPPPTIPATLPDSQGRPRSVGEPPAGAEMAPVRCLPTPPALTTGAVPVEMCPRCERPVTEPWSL